MFRITYIGTPAHAVTSVTQKNNAFVLPVKSKNIASEFQDHYSIASTFPAVDYKQLSSTGDSGDNSETIRKRVENCRAIQQQRFSDHQSVMTNSAMPSKLVNQHCQLEPESHALLEQAMTT